MTGRPAQLGIFTDTPIATTYVRLGLREDVITLIPARERGGEHNKNMRDGLGELILSIPHFPLDDKITPGDLQNLTVYGVERVFQTLAGVYNQKLVSMRAKHDLTFSHLDWGALRGLIVDGEGKTLVNLFSEFGITQDVVNFALGTAAFDVAGRTRVLKENIRRHLRGTPARGVRVLAGGAFFDAYVGHTSVREAYRNLPNAVSPDRDDIRDTFTHAGVTIERVDEDYPFRQPDGTLAILDAVPSNEAIAIPLGTPYFKRYIAPPDSIVEANRAPNPEAKIFVSTDDLPHGKGQEIHSESNLIPICQRPQLIQRLTMS